MDHRLELETAKLARSWDRHSPEMLRDYLVSGVEDPRINLQSILTRHFLARGLNAPALPLLTEQEIWFSAAINVLLQTRAALPTSEDAELLLHALRTGADNFEGTPVPGLLGRLFQRLPAPVESGIVPNYLEAFLTGFVPERSWDLSAPGPVWDLFAGLWAKVAEGWELPEAAASKKVLEVACGSANDYRALRAYGLIRGADYTGIDLCAANIENARALFPDVRFAVGNVFALAEEDRAFDLCFTHDLFEHLSAEGIAAAAAELCRVTRWGLSVAFFNMGLESAHQIEPYEDYHWNRLSAERMRELFARHGFAVRMMHVGTFFAEQTGFEAAHNPHAWTFWMERRG